MDATDVLNSIKRKVIFHNIKILWPFVSTYVLNCYDILASFLILGGKNYCSMAIHSISTTSLLYLLMNVFDRKTTFTYAIADDITSGGKIENLRKWWKFLSSYDLLFGYYSQSHKSLTVMKEV